MQVCIRFIVSLFLLLIGLEGFAQQTEAAPPQPSYVTQLCVYEGDTIPYVSLPAVYIYQPLQFKNKRQARSYNKLVRDVKKVLPIANEVQRAIIETYEYLMTLPDDKARQRHLKAVEKSIKEQYTPRMKKLSYQQGKLLIKLIYRECNSSSYQLIQAFLGPVRAGFYQAFAWAFGASLTKKYDPEGVDRLTERVVLQVEAGQI